MEVRQELKASSPSAGTTASPGTRPQQAPPATAAVRSARRITEQRQTKRRGAVLWLAQGETFPSPNSPDRQSRFSKPLGSYVDNLPAP